MKKVLVLLLTLVLTFSMCFSTFAASDKASKSNGKGSPKAAAEKAGKPNTLEKQFKQEMTQVKKDFAASIETKQADLLDLQNQVEVLKATPLDETNPNAAAERDAALAALQTQIDSLNTDLAGAEAAMKQIINERFMVMKSGYSAEQLAAFGSAQELIAQLYLEAAKPENISLTVKEGLIKLEAPPYLKGGKIMFPIRDIEDIGGVVTYDESLKTVTVTKDNVTVVFTIGSTVATLTQTTEAQPADTTDPVDPVDPIDPNGDGTEPPEPIVTTVDLVVAPEITCGRAFVPLKYLSEVFALAATYDADTQTITVEPPAPEVPDADPVVTE